MSVEEITEKVHKAIARIGTDEAALIDVLTSHDNDFVQKIRKHYEKKYNKPLLDAIKSDTSGDFQTILCSLVQSKAEFCAQHLKKSTKGLGTNEQLLIDVFTQLSNDEKKKTQNFYRSFYNEDLQQRLKVEIGGDFLKLIDTLCNSDRKPGVIQSEVESDAEALYKAGEKKWGTDESTFIKIVTTKSGEHLEAVAEAYQKKYNNTLEKAIKSETSGWFEKGLLALIQPRSVYFANKCRQAIKGIGTDEGSLIRTFTINNKQQLKEIANSYNKLFERSLSDDIKGDCSGHYLKALLALLK